MQLPAGTVDILGTVPSRNRNTLGTAPIRNIRNTLGTGTVPDRNKEYNGHSSQPEQEMQWAQFPARTGVTLAAESQQ